MWINTVNAYVSAPMLQGGKVKLKVCYIHEMEAQQQWKIEHSSYSNSSNTPYISPSQVSYGVPNVSI